MFAELTSLAYLARYPSLILGSTFTIFFLLSSSTSLLTNNSNNYGKYTSSAFDGKMEQAKQASDDAQRWTYLQEAEKIAMDDYAYIPVFEKGTAVLQNTKVSGLVHKPVGVPYTFTYVDIAE